MTLVAGSPWLVTLTGINDTIWTLRGSEGLTINARLIYLSQSWPPWENESAIWFFYFLNLLKGSTENCLKAPSAREHH